MRWLLHGNLAPAVAEALLRHEHKTCLLDELGMTADATPRELLKAAQSKQLDLITADSVIVNTIFDEKIWFNRTIVFLQLEGGDVEQDDAIDRLFARYKRLTSERLYTVTGSRVKIRQLPAKL
jgi:propanediol dehydratase small subunit